MKTIGMGDPYAGLSGMVWDELRMILYFYILIGN